MQYKKQVEGTYCSLDWGTLHGEGEIKKMKNYQKGWSGVLPGPFFLARNIK